MTGASIPVGISVGYADDRITPYMTPRLVAGYRLADSSVDSGFDVARVVELGGRTVVPA